MKPTMAAVLGVLVSLNVMAPTAAAATIFDGFDDFEWQNILSGKNPFNPGPPAANPFSYGYDISETAGRYSVVELTDINATGLVVVDFGTVTYFIERGKENLADADIESIRIRAVPDDPVKGTTDTYVNDTANLTMVVTSYFAWFQGDDTLPYATEIQDDPTYILENSVPAVSVPNPAPIEDLVPTCAGDAEFTLCNATSLHELYLPGLGCVDTPDDATCLVGGTPIRCPCTPEVPKLDDVSQVNFTIVDIDDVVHVLPTVDAYNATAIIESANTSATIQSLLDGLSITGATIEGVLSGLKTSTEEIGTVGIATLSGVLEDRGWTVRKVTNVTDVDPGVYIDATNKSMDFVRAPSFKGEVILLATDAITQASEDAIVALKNNTGGYDTRILAVVSDWADNGTSYVEIVHDALAAGIVDTTAKVYEAQKRLGGAARDTAYIRVDPDADDICKKCVEPPPELWENYGYRVRKAIAENVAQINQVDIDGLLGVPTIEIPLPHKPFLPEKIGGDTLALFNEPSDVDTTTYQEFVKETIGEWRDRYGNFDFHFKDPAIPEVQKDDLTAWLGQLETFAPRATIAVPDVSWPADTTRLVFGTVDQLLVIAKESDLTSQIDETHGTVQFRTVTPSTKTPVTSATVLFTTVLPGWKGTSVQSFSGETNEFGYVVFQVLPQAAYEFNASKKNFAGVSGIGASPPPGQVEGRQVEMQPQEGSQSLIDKVGSMSFLLAITAVLAGGIILTVFVAKKRKGRKKTHGGG